MAVSEPQVSLKDALSVKDFTGSEVTITVSEHPAFGETAVGGYTAALLTKCAALYASRHPKLLHQTDVRSSSTVYYRPVMPSRGPLLVRLRETHLGKNWSVLRAEASQGDHSKLCAGTECIMANLDTLGVTLDTRWRLNPPPPPVDLVGLESDIDSSSGWACHHLAFHPRGFRRGHSYVKFFIPKNYSRDLPHVEQWILPGWDCSPTGHRDPSKPEARFTTDMLPFLVDMNLPIQENFFPRKPDEPTPIASVPSTLAFAAQQARSRNEGKQDWRLVGRGAGGDGSDPDGIKAFVARRNMVSTTIGMTVEVKKKLPLEGVRWLYLRGVVKSARNGQQDLEVVCFDQNMELVAIRTGMEQLFDPATKMRKPSQKTESGVGSKI